MQAAATILQQPSQNLSRPSRVTVTFLLKVLLIQTPAIRPNAGPGKLHATVSAQHPYAGLGRNGTAVLPALGAAQVAEYAIINAGLTVLTTNTGTTTGYAVMGKVHVSWRAARLQAIPISAAMTAGVIAAIRGIRALSFPAKMARAHACLTAV